MCRVCTLHMPKYATRKKGMLNKIEEFNKRISEWFEWIGVAGLVLMMLITTIDVIGAKVFNSPFLGAIDIVELTQVIALSFANSMTLIVGRHIRVEFVFNLLPPSTQNLINTIVNFLGLILFVIIIWRVIVLAYSFQSSGEYSMAAYIPYHPFTYALAIACIPVLINLLLTFIKTLTYEE